MKERLLILDIGSSSVRASLYNTRAERVIGMEARRRQVWLEDEAGQPVLSASGLLDEVSLLIDDLLAKVDPQTERVAVGMTTLVGNVVGLDGGGEAITPIYTYADTRSAAEVQALKAALGDELADVLERTGCPLHPAYWPSLLKHLGRSRPDLMERVQRWTDLAGFLYGQWFGRFVPIGPSTASWSGLFDRTAWGWSEALLQQLPLTVAQLPAIGRMKEPLRGLSPRWAARWPQLARADFYLPVGDGAAANLGAAGFSGEALVLTIGSTSAARVTVPGTPRRPAGLWAYRIDENYSLEGGALNEGGNGFAWLSERLVLPEARALEQALQALAPAAHGLTVLPFLKGERAPGWQAQATAQLVGLKESTSNVEIVQAWLEGIAYRLALVVEALPERAYVAASGGALLASRAWQQIFADVLGKPLHPVTETEASSRGTAYLLAHYRGHAPTLEPFAPAVLPRPEAQDAYRQARVEHNRLYRQSYSPETV